MRLSRPFTALAAAAAVLLVPAGAIAQRQQPTPEQRIDRLERQVNEMQRRVYPKGKPADTAGFSDDPAATQSSVITLDQRLDALERQMADMLRQSEENGNRLRSMEQGIGQLKSDEDQRIQALEQRMTAAEAAPSAAAPATDGVGDCQADDHDQASDDQAQAQDFAATAQGRRRHASPRSGRRRSCRLSDRPGRGCVQPGFPPVGSGPV